MAPTKILLVDDVPQVRETMQQLLEHENFDVVAAAGVPGALSQIVTQNFDVLITDLHMPDAGDGFALVTAMRHIHPAALIIVVSGFPDMQEAATAILLQADEVLMKPLNVKKVTELIQQKQRGKAQPMADKESVASILEREVRQTIDRWLARVRLTKELTDLTLSDEERTEYLPQIIRDIVARLRKVRVIEVIAVPSAAAVAHGELRCRQGYSAPMVVHESRILQVCIFETIQKNLASLDFSVVLPDVMLIADEVDSQLTQCIGSFLKGAGAMSVA